MELHGLTYSKWRPAQSDTAVDGGSNKTYFRPTQKKKKYQCKCVLYLVYFHGLTSPSDGKPKRSWLHLHILSFRTSCMRGPLSL